MLVLHTARVSAENAHDFGGIIRGFVYTNAFVIANQYPTTLRVTRVRLLCPCVKLLSYDTVIPSGGTGRIVLILDTQKLYEGKVRYGTMVHMTTNELAANSMPVLIASTNAAATYTEPAVPYTGAEEIRSLLLDATIQDDVAVMPAVNDFGKVAPGGCVPPFKVDVCSRIGREIMAVNVAAMPPWLGATATPSAEASAGGVTSRWTISFACTNLPPTGLLNVHAPFTILLKNRGQQVLPTNGQYGVVIKGTVDPLYVPQPPLVVLTHVAVSSCVEQTVAFSSPPGVAMHITGARSSGRSVTVAMPVTNDPFNASVVLRISPAQVGMIDEIITISTDNEAQREVSVRVLGNAR